MAVQRCEVCSGKFDTDNEKTCPACSTTKVASKKVETKVKK